MEGHGIGNGCSPSLGFVPLCGCSKDGLGEHTRQWHTGAGSCEETIHKATKAVKSLVVIDGERARKEMKTTTARDVLCEQSDWCRTGAVPASEKG